LIAAKPSLFYLFVIVVSSQTQKMGGKGKLFLFLGRYTF